MDNESNIVISENDDASNFCFAKSRDRISCSICPYEGRKDNFLRRHIQHHILPSGEKKKQKCRYCLYWCKPCVLKQHERLHEIN